MYRRYCGVLCGVLTAITIAFLVQGSAYAEKFCPKCNKHFADKYAFCDREGSKLSQIKVSAPKPKQKSRIRTEARTHLNLSPKAEMIYIPAGEFVMGSAFGWSSEKPVHRVYLYGYEIGKYEVTVAQYRKFAKATGRKIPKAPPWGWKDDHPMEIKNWADADAYCKWAGGRLPTEAEWEKAARGTDGRQYPWGNAWSKKKCARFDSLHSTAPIGSYPSGASPYGCQDMTGNVMEWCSDWYSDCYYSQTPLEGWKNPQGPESGSSHVIRGGDDSSAGRCVARCLILEQAVTEVHGGGFGFRLAR